MSRIRVGVAVLAASLVASGWLIGGDEKKPDEPPKARGTLPIYWKQLGLTRDQVQDVYKIQSKYTSEIDKLRAKIDALKAEEKAELEKMLSDEQKKKLKELRSGEKPIDKDKPVKDGEKDKPVKDGDKDKPVKDGDKDKPVKDSDKDKAKDKDKPKDK